MALAAHLGMAVLSGNEASSPGDLPSNSVYLSSDHLLWGP